MQGDTSRVQEVLVRAAKDSRAKLIALLSARSRDIGSAEDAFSEALATALVTWSRDGLPQNPEAWLLTVARRRQIDRIRREAVLPMSLDNAGLEDVHDESNERASGIPDRRLELLLICAHPAIDEKIRAPLMLQVVLGLDSATVAGAFLVSPAAMAQRLVRAKEKIRLSGIRFELLERDDIAPRLSPVLDAIYATYTHGWAEPASNEPAAGRLTDEALWLAALLAKLVPNQPEVLGLLSLMLHLEARSAARITAGGVYVPLSEQDTTQWKAELIDEADSLLWRACQHRLVGRYQLEAAIQSAHADRRRIEEPNWTVIDQLYGQLERLTGSPVVTINRAVVRAKVSGAASGLHVLETVQDDPRFTRYQPFWAAKAGLLAELGDAAHAERAYERAISLACADSTKSYLIARRDELRRRSSAPPPLGSHHSAHVASA